MFLPVYLLLFGLVVPPPAVPAPLTLSLVQARLAVAHTCSGFSRCCLGQSSPTRSIPPLGSASAVRLASAWCCALSARGAPSVLPGRPWHSGVIYSSAPPTKPLNRWGGLLRCCVVAPPAFSASLSWLRHFGGYELVRLPRPPRARTPSLRAQVAPSGALAVLGFPSASFWSLY